MEEFNQIHLIVGALLASVFMIWWMVTRIQNLDVDAFTITGGLFVALVIGYLWPLLIFIAGFTAVCWAVASGINYLINRHRTRKMKQREKALAATSFKN